jgi:hypothetical protein
MESLANAIKLAQASLGLDDNDFDSTSYSPAGGTSWKIAFFLDSRLVGEATEDGG